MNPKVKQLWIEALESGLYRQTSGKLASEVGFCCLGVLCEIAIKSGLDIVRDTEHYVFPQYDGNLTHLPDKVMAWAGILDGSASYDDTSLIDDNDSGKNFKEIAQIIREHF